MSTTTPKILWTPNEHTMRSSHLAHFIAWCAQNDFLPATFDGFDPGSFAFDPEKSNLDLYNALLTWSNQHPAEFWEAIWQYFRVIGHAPFQEILSGCTMPGARWFEGATLNYAEHIFRNKTAAHPAIVFKDERHAAVNISWAELEAQTAAMAAFLRACGVQKGDRVAAFLPNTPHAMIACLAALSIGAVWSSCSPDFGAESVADRFVQIEPKVLIAVDGYTYNGKSFDKMDVVAEICSLLPSVQKVVLVPYLNPIPRLEQLPNAVSWQAALQQPAEPLVFSPLPFSHPIWVLYSSGTTGVPKAITHSHGGNLLEHLKYLHLHNDVHAGERFFWYSTTGWMMWNFTLASLLAGATIVLYEGSPAYPNINMLWQLAADTRITHFGTSAPFLVACMKAGLHPGRNFDLSALRSIGSTGAPLPPEAFAWVYDSIKSDLWLSSMAGGTDVCTAWVGGNPLLPVYQGEIQCRCLGCNMQSWDANGQPLGTDETGEMMVLGPMPSMPVYFWNDPDGKKYQSSYFEDFPGVWRHGDWIRITPRSTVVILGRSDATLNRQGVRIGTAEIYRALDKIPELRDSLIINVERADGSDWMPLFICLSDGAVLDEALKHKINQILRSEYSPRHVPDVIIEAPDIPYTISGKKMETPVKRIFLKHPLEKAYNRDSMRNPESMAFFIEMASQQS